MKGPLSPLFNIITMMVIFLLDHIVSDGQSAVILSFVLLYFYFLPSCLWFMICLGMVFFMFLLLGGHLASVISDFTVFIKFGNILATISSS